MNRVITPRIATAVAARVLRQLRHDHRSLAMLVVLPCLILALLRWIYDAQPMAFDRLGPALLALIPFTVMFLVTSVTTLRERSSGTLERLLAMPTTKLDFLLGYALAFGAVAVLQATLAVSLSVTLLGLSVDGPVWALVVVAVADAVLGTSLGLFVSAFARTEFQAVQFMPLLVIPQILLCGLFVPRDELPTGLGALSDLLPLSYAVDAMSDTSDAVPELLVICGFTVGLLALGAATLRRRTA
jgi:ABC-2 type transport system permease protein